MFSLPLADNMHGQPDALQVHTGLSMKGFFVSDGSSSSSYASGTFNSLNTTEIILNYNPTYLGHHCTTTPTPLFCNIGSDIAMRVGYTSGSTASNNSTGAYKYIPAGEMRTIPLHDLLAGTAGSSASFSLYVRSDSASGGKLLYEMPIAQLTSR